MGIIGRGKLMHNRLASLVEQAVVRSSVKPLGSIALCHFTVAPIDCKSKVEQNYILLKQVAGVVHMWTGAVAQVGRCSQEDQLTPAAERKAI